MQNIRSLVIHFIQILAIAFILALFLFSLFYQTVLPMDGSEMAQMNRMPYPSILLAIFLLIATIKFLPLLGRIKASHLFLVFSLVYLFLGSYLILNVTDTLRFDARVVYDAAVSLNNGNKSTLEIGAYLYRYPHQLGLVTFERILFHLFQSTSPKILFFLNMIFVIGINFLTWKSTTLLYQNSLMDKLVIVLSFLFLPQFFFILFAYGHILGLFFLMIAVYELLLFLQKKRIQDGVLLILATGIAYTIRNNYSIFVIAVVLILLLDLLTRVNQRTIAVIVGLVAVCLLSQKLLTQHYEEMAAHSLSGVPKIAWVTMGLNDNPVYKRVPGWYDAYVETVYTENKGNTKAIAKQSLQDLKQRLKIMVQHPVYALRFFKNKFVSTWEDSLFQSVWSGPVKSEGQFVKTPLLQSIYYGKKLFHLLYMMTHAGLIFLYFSLVVGIGKFIKKERRLPLEILIFPLYLLGGIFFHLFWETKSQYVYSYVFMMLPISAYGLSHIRELLKRKIKGNF